MFFDQYFGTYKNIKNLKVLPTYHILFLFCKKHIFNKVPNFFFLAQNINLCLNQCTVLMTDLIDRV